MNILVTLIKRRRGVKNLRTFPKGYSTHLLIIFNIRRFQQPKILKHCHTKKYDIYLLSHVWVLLNNVNTTIFHRIKGQIILF